MGLDNKGFKRGNLLVSPLFSIFEAEGMRPGGAAPMLRLPWHGRVFCNPPYDKALIAQFIQRCAEHRNAVALTFVRTDTKLFQELIFPRADSILFIKGRVSFCHASGVQGGPAGAPSCLIAFDRQNTERLEQSGIEGCLVRL